MSASLTPRAIKSRSWACTRLAVCASRGNVMAFVPMSLNRRASMACVANSSNCLHLIGCQRIEIGNTKRGQVNNSLDECFAGDTLINRATIRANVVDQAHENFIYWTTSKMFKVKRAQGFTRPPRLRISEKPE